MAWVKTGTVAVTNGSTTVTGTGTSWFGALQTGWGFVGPDQGIYEILTVDSATQITLATPYLGANASAQSYAAFPTSSLSADLTATLQALISNYQGVYDTVGQGRFQDGTSAAPGMAFDADRDTGISRPAPNTIAIGAGGVDQLELSGGAASGAAVQSDATDATLGKLMKVAAFGLGEAHAMPTLSDADDFNAAAGLYRIIGTTLNRPFDLGTCLVLRNGTNRITQLVQQALAGGNHGRLQYRHYFDGTWSSWATVYSTENILGTVSQSGGIPTGAVIERGSNANGEYVRYADGTQICTSPDWSLDVTTSTGSLFRSATPQSWTFPAAFIGTGGVAGGVAVTGNSQTHFGALRISSPTAGEVTLFGPVSIAGRAARAFAIGRWF